VPNAGTMPRQNPIDFDHLRSITFGDRALESEVLGLFGERASASLIAIEQSPNADAREAAAHRLVGAARAIGANQLAAAAEEIERAGEVSPTAIDSLSDAMAAVIEILEDRMSRVIDQPEAG
jgi:HPt (histidine-containing phosphotransfer) domain-containing protein